MELLAFTNVGGPIIPTLDGEYCRIIKNQIYTGTILSNSPAAHVYEDAKTKKEHVIQCIFVLMKSEDKRRCATIRYL